MCTALVVGNTIGMGIFMLPASLAPYGLNALPAWLITAAGCICVAWVFAGLARSFPEDDGPYAYASRAFGNGIAFLMLWCYWISTWVTNAAIAGGVVGYLSTFFPVLNVNHALAAVTAPLALFTAYKGLTDQFKKHKAIARWTLPIWLYVSVTGVVVYWMLYRLPASP